MTITCLLKRFGANVACRPGWGEVHLMELKLTFLYPKSIFTLLNENVLGLSSCNKFGLAPKIRHNIFILQLTQFQYIIDDNIY